MNVLPGPIIGSHIAKPACIENLDGGSQSQLFKNSDPAGSGVQNANPPTVGVKVDVASGANSSQTLAATNGCHAKPPFWTIVPTRTPARPIRLSMLSKLRVPIGTQHDPGVGPPMGEVPGTASEPRFKLDQTTSHGRLDEIRTDVKSVACRTSDANTLAAEKLAPANARLALVALIP